MRVIGILLLILGVIGLILGAMMFGDIGLSCIIAALVGLLAGIGFLATASYLKKTER